MAGLSRSGVMGGSTRKITLQIALAVAVVVGVLALKYHAKTLIKASPIGESDRQYEALRLRDSSTALGLRREGTRLIVDEWKPGSDKIKRREVELGEEVPLKSLRIASDASFVAWALGHELWIHDFKEDSTAVRIPVRSRASLVDVVVLGDGSLVVLFSDGAMERWNGKKQELEESQRIPLNNPDQMAADEDYIAAASSSEGKLVIYRQGLGSSLRVVEEVRCPPPPFDLVMAGHGQAALITQGGVFLNGKTLNTPGHVRSLAFGAESELLVAGDFTGIHAAPRNDETYSIADAPSGGVIAATENYLVHSSASGTRTYTFGSQLSLNDSGRNLIWVAGAFGLIAIIALLDRIMLGVFQRQPKARKGRKRLDAPRDFEDPDEELVTACRMGDVALWAGSGLSAQCGFPIRRHFVRQLVDAGRFEGWLKNDDADALQAMCDRGQTEQAIDALLLERPEARKIVAAQVKSSYRRTLDVSPAHKWLAQIPFAAAVTTNYDALLEELGMGWGRNLCHPKMRMSQLGDRAQDFFLLKLYGDLFRPHTTLMGRSEALAELKQPDGLAPLVRDLLAHKTVLFAGCSLEGLLGDLPALVPKDADRAHYVLAGVWDPDWRKHVGALAKLGVRVIPCSEETVAAALPRFLEKLVKRVAGMETTSDQTAFTPSAR